MLELNRVSGSVMIVYNYKRERARAMATNGEMIDLIQEWINTDGELLSDEQVLENIRELVNGGGL
jgi:hypothetical protein